MASLTQLAFACVTLYRARGDQIDRFGYAAFGLTVIPYAIMSFVNFIANILVPEYSALYMVHSDIMDEAEARGAKFDGAVGRLEITPDKKDELELEFESVSQEGREVRFRDPGGIRLGRRSLRRAARIRGTILRSASAARREP